MHTSAPELFGMNCSSKIYRAHVGNANIVEKM
jgi:hypothetical protein